MATDLDELRAIERLLREAEAKLGVFGTFRQKTLLQMTVFEVQRRLHAVEQADKNSELRPKSREEPAR